MPRVGHLAQAGSEPIPKIFLKCDREREFLCSIVRCEIQALLATMFHTTYMRESLQRKKNEAKTQKEAVMGETEVGPDAFESLVLVVSDTQWDVCPSHSLASQSFPCSHEIVLVFF